MARLFVLAAVMYVNDTDMLHWPPSPHSSPEELIEHVQQATMDWGNLTQASGGILKAQKCSAYFMDYKFNRGRAKMKSRRDLPEPTQYISEEVGYSHCISQSHNQWARMPQLLRTMSLPPQRC
jgi:hypothetical protein